jgi:hypothetical protein
VESKLDMMKVALNALRTRHEQMRTLSVVYKRQYDLAIASDDPVDIMNELDRQVGLGEDYVGKSQRTA